MTVEDCRIIELPKFLDVRGNLSFAENFAQIPFEIKRTYWLYDVPGGSYRGAHAHIELRKGGAGDGQSGRLRPASRRQRDRTQHPRRQEGSTDGL